MPQINWSWLQINYLMAGFVYKHPPIWFIYGSQKWPLNELVGCLKIHLKQNNTPNFLVITTSPYDLAPCRGQDIGRHSNDKVMSCSMRCVGHAPAELVNSLWLSDAVRPHRSWSTLAQVMACCLMAISHYLNQCWLLTSEVLLHSSESDFMANAQATMLYNTMS